MIGRREVLSYARGVAQMTGVDIHLHDGPPRTDGKRVWLDGSPCESERHFEGRCGTGNHEIAHVFFETPQNMKGWAQKVAKKHDAEWATFAAFECLNVVMDIADETRMERVFPQMARAFRTQNLLAMAAIRDLKGDKVPPPWRRALLSGIVVARARKFTREDEWVAGFHPDTLLDHFKNPTGADGFAEVLVLTKRCVQSEKPIPVENKLRSRAMLTTLKKRAERLFEIVLPHIKKEQGPGPGQGPGGKPGDKPGDSDPMRKHREKGVKEESDRVLAGTSKADCYNGVRMDANMYAQATVHLAHAVDVLMETERSNKVDRRGEEGQSLSRRWTSVFTDGKVFLNPQQGHGYELNLALALDKSGSMHHVMPKALGVCKALMDVMDGNGANVKCWTFGSHTEEMYPEGLEGPMNLEGSTIGYDAIEGATEWLSRQETGRRMLLVITDGVWGYRSHAKRALAEAFAQGIELLFIGLRHTQQRLDVMWPGVPSIACGNDADELTELLIRATERAIT
jgi:hypothetical protein